MLQSANNGNKSTSKGGIIQPTKEDSEWEEFLQYQQTRNQSKSLIAAVTGDVTVNLTVPYLVLTSQEINQTNFSEGLASILLESLSVIIFSTEHLTSKGLSRLAMILEDLQGLFDSRLTVLVQIRDKVPSPISEYVEKVFDPLVNTRKRKLESSEEETDKIIEKDNVGSKKGKSYLRDKEFNFEIVDKKDTELSEAKKTIQELRELLAKKEKEFNSAIDCEREKQQEILSRQETEFDTAIGSEREKQQELLAKKDKDFNTFIDCERKKQKDLLALKEKEFDIAINCEREKLQELLALKEKEFVTSIDCERKQQQFDLELQSKLDAVNEEYIILGDKHESTLSEKALLEINISKLKSERLVMESELEDEKGKLLSLMKKKDLKSSAKEINQSEYEKQEETIKLKAESDKDRLEFYKSKVSKNSQNPKLSSKEIVYRSFRNLKINENVVIKTENDQEFICELNVTKDNTGILLNNLFVGSGTSRHKSIVDAYSKIVSFVTT